MRQLIDRFGVLPALPVSTKLLEDLLESIVSQQLSLKAAGTIWNRFIEKLPNRTLTAPAVVALSPDELRSCGISFAKIRAMQELCQEVIDGTLDLTELPTLDNQALYERLLRLRGIGPWTTEMLMIFSLGREDVFSPGDMGLRNAIAKLYGIDKNDALAIEKLSQQWQPYRSYASRYLWKSLDNEPKTNS